MLIRVVSITLHSGNLSVLIESGCVDVMGEGYHIICGELKDLPVDRVCASLPVCVCVFVCNPSNFVLHIGHIKSYTLLMCFGFQHNEATVSADAY